MPFPGDGQGKTCTKPAPRTPSASPPPAPCTALFLCSAARFRAGRGRFFSAIFPPPTLRRMRQGGASPHHPAFSPPAPPRFPAFFWCSPLRRGFAWRLRTFSPCAGLCPRAFPHAGGVFDRTRRETGSNRSPHAGRGEALCRHEGRLAFPPPPASPCGEGLCLLPLIQRVLCRQKAF